MLRKIQGSSQNVNSEFSYSKSPYSSAEIQNVRTGSLSVHKFESELNCSHLTGSWNGIWIGMTGRRMYCIAIQRHLGKSLSRGISLVTFWLIGKTCPYFLHHLKNFIAVSIWIMITGVDFLINKNLFSCGSLHNTM